MINFLNFVLKVFHFKSLPMYSIHYYYFLKVCNKINYHKINFNMKYMNQIKLKSYLEFQIIHL